MTLLHEPPDIHSQNSCCDAGSVEHKHSERKLFSLVSRIMVIFDRLENKPNMNFMSIMTFTLLSFCFLQSPDYSEVFGSSEEIGYGEHEMDRHSDIVAKGHTPSIDRQMETGRQESQSDSQKKADNIMDPQLLETRKRPEPPPQSAKPTLAKTRQRHLEESSGTAHFVFI